MDLIQIAKNLKEKEKRRDQLLGQKSMLLENLKEVGFESLKQAKKTLLLKEQELEKLKKHYKEGEELFITKFKSLLEN